MSCPDAAIRPLDPDRDLPALSAFLIDKDVSRLNLCLKAVADGHAFILVAELNDQAVGLGIVHTAPRHDQGWTPTWGTWEFLQAGDAYLENIEVKNTLRNQGIGTRLLNALETEARNRGKARIWTHSGEHNTGAQRVYERHGWQHKQTLQVPWQPPGRPSRVYCKDLGGIGCASSRISEWPAG